jgi:S-DNA-T family DNA segregation ATPase FtsK/SpoIIIE
MATPNSSPRTPQRDKKDTPGEGTLAWWWIVIRKAIDSLDEVLAVLLGAASLITILGMLGLTAGSLIDSWVGFVERWFGYGAFIFPVSCLGVSVFLLRWRMGLPTNIPWLRLIALEFFLFAALAWLASIDGMDLTRAELGYGGGLIGWGIATPLQDVLGPTGAVILLILVMAGTGVYTFGGILQWTLDYLQSRSEHPRAIEPPSPESSLTVLAKPDPKSATSKKPTQVPKEFRKQFRVQTKPERERRSPVVRQEGLPSIEILARGRSATVTSREVNTTAGLIEKTLADFGIPAKVVDFRTGPAVTQYAVEPGYIEGGPDLGKRQKVRVSQISALANDLALALTASAIRIEAPVPGKSYVGVEVPNRNASRVRMRPILESSAFHSLDSPLAIGLGRDVAGNPLAADLASMPHLLIAGTTGSGKSVSIASIATALAMNNTPKNLRFVMIDPKMVELLRFNGLPHLFGKVETELDRITGVLRWCTLEMDQRYKALEEAGARDIEAYNKRARRRRTLESMPRIVVFIDELADLMMMAPDQTERTLVRLAQMARATGIHLVVATQRPSTDILTGLIKANFPARISFAVAASVDSRVILDTVGAETLLGKGDMLYLAPEAGVPIRLQGVFVSDKEIEKLVNQWKELYSSEEQVTGTPPWEDLLLRQQVLDDKDEIIERAIQVVRNSGEASASMLQRRLRIGYPRAARLMDELEELGVVGKPQSGGKTREVLIREDEDPLQQPSDFDETPDRSPDIQ